MIFLKGTKVYLRAPEPSDIECMYRWENDSRIWEYGSTRTPLSHKQIYDYVQSYDGNIFTSGQLRLIIVRCDTDEACGAVDLTSFDPINRRAEVGIVVNKGDIGKGVASEALNLIGEYASGCLSLHQLWCTIGVDNAPSRHLFEKAQFSRVGYLKSWVFFNGRYSDAYLYQKLFQ